MKTAHGYIVIKNFERVLLFVLFCFIFFSLIKYITTDMTAHINFIQRVNTGNSSYPIHFLFFFLTNMLSFFTNDYNFMVYAVVALLSLACVAKYAITEAMLLDFGLSYTHRYKREIIKGLSFTLLFAFTIPDVYNFFYLKYMYIGRLPSMVWHNSTTITLFPFAILLFWKQYKMFSNPPKSVVDNNLLIAILLVVINAFLKPSFLFVYIPATIIIVLRGFKIQNFKKYIFQLLPVIISGVVIIIQYIILYHNKKNALYDIESSVAIKPLEFFAYYIPLWYIPIALLLSFIFPLCTMIFYKNIIKNKLFLYSLLLAFFGLIISVFVNETGVRGYDGNFTWQSIVCSYLLMLTTTIYLFPKFLDRNTRYSKKMIILMGVFIAHFFSGMLYLVKIYFTRTYF